MNFLKAQTAHVVWKSRIEKHIYGSSDAHIDVANIANKDVCELGIWLNENEKVLSKSKHFSKVDELHRQFHKLIKIRVDSKEEIDGSNIKKNEPYKEVSHQLKIKLSQLAHDFDYLI